MTNNSLPHSRSDIFQNQANPTKNQNAHGDVRQDKRAFTRARIRSAQPARSHIPMRAQPLTTNTPRSQNPPITKRQTVQLTLWVEPIVKAEIQRRAHLENLSVSSVGAALLRQGMQTDLDMQYGALLRPIIEDAIKTNLRLMSTRLALLLVRVAFASEQTRSLVTNILSRQPARKPEQSISPEVLNDILDRSAEAAKAKITQKYPELEKPIAEVKSWFDTQEKKTNV